MHLLQAVPCCAMPRLQQEQAAASDNSQQPAQRQPPWLPSIGCKWNPRADINLTRLAVIISGQETMLCLSGTPPCQDTAGCQPLCGLQGRIFYYLLIMGWSLREHEVNLDFEQVSSSFWPEPC